jgi:hypothetical protein
MPREFRHANIAVPSIEGHRMLRSIIACITVLGLIGCSSEPRQLDAKTPPVAPPAAASEAAPAAQPSAPAPAVSRKVLSDYKLRVKDGKKYYCTREALLGSHFEKTICLTEEQVAEVEQRRQQQRDDLEKAQKNCGGKMCTGGP